MASENTELSLTIIDNSIEVFKSGTAILQEHKNTATKALLYADKLLKEWEVANAIEDPDQKSVALSEVDVRAQAFLVRCRDKKTERMEERKAITQLMTSIAGMFTEQESLLDITKSDKLIKNQNHRNNYAKWRLAEDARKKKEADDKANKSKEEADIRAFLMKRIADWLLTMLSDRKKKMQVSFNAITLETYEEKSAALSNASTSFPQKKLDELVLDNPPFKYHAFSEIEPMKIGVRASYDFDAFFVQYNKEIAAYKKELIDKLPSKKAELDEVERLRLKAIQDKEELDKKLKKAKDDADAKKKLEDDAAAQKKKDDDALQKIADEKLLREEQDRQKLAEEDKNKKEQAGQNIELEKAGAQANTMFDQTLESTPEKPAPSAKKSFIINIKHQAAWVQLFQFYYEKEGKTLSLADWEKKTMKQIKTFCEKWATKNEEMIESKFIEYEEDVKARNVKE